MTPLTDLLGETNQAKVLEALLRLGNLEFTRAELAREANIWPMSVNRVFEALIDESLVFEAKGGTRPAYRVNEVSARLQLLARFGAGLGLIQRNGLDAPDSERTLEGRRRAMDGVREPFRIREDDLIQGILSPPTERSVPMLEEQTASSGQSEVKQLPDVAGRATPIPIVAVVDTTQGRPAAKGRRSSEGDAL